MQGQITRLGWPNNRSNKQASKVRQEIKIPPERPRKRLSHAVSSGLSPQHQHVKNTSSHVSALCQLKRFLLKNHQPTRGYTGNHCTIRKLCTWETMKMFKKWNTKILLWGFLSGGFLSWGFCLGGFYRGYMSRGFLSRGVVLEPSSLLHINRFFSYCFVWGLFW